MTTSAPPCPALAPARQPDPARVVNAINGYQHRLCHSSEAALRESVAHLLAAAWVPLELGVPLGPAGRADLLAFGSIVVDVMVSGSVEEATLRLRWYASSPAVTAIILVTPVSRHRAVPPAIGGTPVFVAWVRRPAGALQPAGLQHGSPGLDAAAASLLTRGWPGGPAGPSPVTAEPAAGA